jgi:hypothetical protein
VCGLLEILRVLLAGLLGRLDSGVRRAPGDLLAVLDRVLGRALDLLLDLTTTR